MRTAEPKQSSPSWEAPVRTSVAARSGIRNKALTAAPPIVSEVLRSPGRPLHAATRSFMEARFGHDFGNVRVHADERAAESARAVHAKAYAVGNDIVFNRGEYQPRSAAGLASLAHELTHVVQQTGGGPGSVPAHIEMGAASDSAEREAQQAGHRGWQREAVSLREGPCLRRQPAQGSGDEPEKKPPPIIQKGDWVIDPKLGPLGPLEGGSLEDVNKAIHNLASSQGNKTCPDGWRMRYEGLCCPGFSVDVDRCRPVRRMTSTGGVCAVDEYAEGDRCKKIPSAPPSSPAPITHPAEPLTRGDLPKPGDNVLTHKPLTVSMDIYFKQNQPGTIAGDDKALRESLTVSGAGTLDDVVAWLKRDPKYSVQLTGRASMEGPTAHNRELGESRAYSVAGALARVDLAGRIEDVPGMPTSCSKSGDGIYNCGDTGASKTVDERDRQVRATLFIAPGRRP